MSLVTGVWLTTRLASGIFTESLGDATNVVFDPQKGMFFYGAVRDQDQQTRCPAFILYSSPTDTVDRFQTRGLM